MPNVRIHRVYPVKDEYQEYRSLHPDLIYMDDATQDEFIRVWKTETLGGAVYEFNKALKQLGVEIAKALYLDKLLNWIERKLR